MPALEVIVFGPRSRILARAEAANLPALVYAGRVLHDEAAPHAMGSGSLTVGFFVDGKLSRLVEGRP